MTEEISFLVSLEDWQGFSIPDGGGKFIPPARNSEWKRSGEWFCASLWWYEASLTSRSQTSGGDVYCHKGVEAGAEPVAVLYASISVLNLIRAANVSQCREIKRGVTWALLGSQKTSRAAECPLLNPDWLASSRLCFDSGVWSDVYEEHQITRGYKGQHLLAWRRGNGTNLKIPLIIYF